MSAVLSLFEPFLQFPFLFWIFAFLGPIYSLIVSNLCTRPSFWRKMCLIVLISSVWVYFLPFPPTLHPTLPSSELVSAQALLLKLLPCFQSRSCIPNANGRHVNVPSLRVIAEPTFSASFDLFYPASVSNMHFLSKGSSLSGRHSAAPCSSASPSFCF